MTKLAASPSPVWAGGMSVSPTEGIVGVLLDAAALPVLLSRRGAGLATCPTVVGNEEVGVEA